MQNTIKVYKINTPNDMSHFKKHETYKLYLIKT